MMRYRSKPQEVEAVHGWRVADETAWRYRDDGERADG